MITERNIKNEHKKNILLFENSSERSRSYADQIRRSGFRVSSVLAGKNAVQAIRSKRLDIDLIIIRTNRALKELGGEQVLDILMHYEVPILILSTDNKIRRELKIDRESSFRIIDHASDVSALDDTIHRVLDVYREDNTRNPGTGNGTVTQQLPVKSESRQFFESSQEAIVFFNATTRRLTDMNPSMEQLTGMERNKLIGKSIDEISFFKSLDLGDNLLEEIIARERAKYVNCKAEKADGRDVNFTIKGEAYRSGEKVMIRCTLEETGQKASTNKLLSDELQKKEMMIHELQHRTKNTFAMIMGLVELKSFSSESEESKQMLSELAMRIQSISELYQLLYKNDSSDKVNLATYCAVISNSIVGVDRNISINQKTDDIFIGTKKATSVGLILVELLYNIMKYAFPDESIDKQVCVHLTRKNDGIILKVKDNGIGLPNDFEVEGSSSSGLSLVQMLADQLGGTVKISSNRGTTVVVEVKI